MSQKKWAVVEYLDKHSKYVVAAGVSLAEDEKSAKILAVMWMLSSIENNFVCVMPFTDSNSLNLLQPSKFKISRAIARERLRGVFRELSGKIKEQLELDADKFIELRGPSWIASWRNSGKPQLSFAKNEALTRLNQGRFDPFLFELLDGDVLARLEEIMLADTV